MGQKGVKKSIFQKVIPARLRCSNKCFRPMSSLFVTGIGPRKLAKCFENGPLFGPKMCQNRSKKQFPKSYPSPFGVLKSVFLAQFEPVVMHFGPWKNPKCFENRPFLDEK